MQEAYQTVIKQHVAPVQNQQANRRYGISERKFQSKPPLLVTPTMGTSMALGVNRRTLSKEEMNDRRARVHNLVGATRS